MPNILLVYPKFPLSYWGFQFAMDFIGRKACMPPLGLLTVAGMFPNETYKLRVVDMNVETLSDAHLSWADGGYEENYLLNAVRKIQEQGIEVAAGFILGADGDTEASFDAHIEFIQTAGIVMAMEGLLTVLKETSLYQRLEREGRLLGESLGNNVSTALNFIPQIDRDTLIAGYKRVLSTLYDPTLRNYFERCWIMVQHLHPTNYRVRRVGSREVKAFCKTLWRQLPSRQGIAYVRFLARVLRTRPRMFPEAVRFAIEGYHFEKVTRQVVAC